MARRCVWSRNLVCEEAIAPLEGWKIQTHNGGVVAPVEKKTHFYALQDVKRKNQYDASHAT